MSTLIHPLPPRLDPSLLEAGTDEAGRGCLAGPVVAAAVILPPDFADPRINDSKQLSRRVRDELRVIIRRSAIAWGIGIASVAEIDDINILNASILAMHRALDALSVRPQSIVVDGNRFRTYGDIPHRTVVRGDSLLADIAAASILAKTTRDDLMDALSADYPDYGWQRNAGYPTAQHREAIRRLGPTPHHRMSFRLLDPQLQLPL